MLHQLVGDLTFHGTPHGDEVKLAVFAASLASALLGLVVLSLTSRRGAPTHGGGEGGGYIEKALTNTVE